MGGLDQVATVLVELADQLNPDRLLALAKAAPKPWAQRLGYLLEFVGYGEKVASLKKYVHATTRDVVLLLPAAPDRKAEIDRDWRLAVNARVETDI